jgi:hypothetical protein
MSAIRKGRYGEILRGLRAGMLVEWRDSQENKLSGLDGPVPTY